MLCFHEFLSKTAGLTLWELRCALTLQMGIILDVFIIYLVRQVLTQFKLEVTELILQLSAPKC